jgi:hypothetical protein
VENHVGSPEEEADEEENIVRRTKNCKNSLHVEKSGKNASKGPHGKNNSQNNIHLPGLPSKLIFKMDWTQVVKILEDDL